jgi:predicted regulator of Ras-like GTPase activity (Roadblock/LC7/MglB family)
MLGFLKKLFGGSDTQPPAAAPAVKPAATPVAAPAAKPAAAAAKSAPTQPTATSKASGVAGGSASAQGAAPAAGPGEVTEINLQAILAKLPDELKGSVKGSPGGKVTVPIPTQTILEQMPSGVVKVNFGLLRQVAPRGTFADDSGRDENLVTIPLAAIMVSINPALLKRRVSQKKVDVPDDVTGLFHKGSTPPPVPPSTASTPAAPAPTSADAVAEKPVSPAPPAEAKAHVVESTAPPAPAAVPAPPPAPKPPEKPASIAVSPALREMMAAASASAKPATPPPAPKPPAPPASAVPKPPSPAPSTVPKPPSAAPSAVPKPPSPPAAAVPKPPAPPPAPAPAPAPKPPVPAPSPEPAPVVAPSTEVGELSVPLAEVSKAWPESVKAALAALPPDSMLSLPTGDLGNAIRAGKIVFTWKQLRTWIQPQPITAESGEDPALLTLPLSVIVPLFMAKSQPARAQRKASFDETIPDMFASGKAGAPAVAPPAPVAPPVPAPPAAPATPNQSVEQACAIAGVAGALLVSQDGFVVAHKLPAGINGETVAAFLPQMIGRMSQYAKEMNLGEMSTVSWVVDNIPWQLCKAGSLYFAVLGRPGETLPAAPLNKLAAEIGRQNK